MTMYPDSEQCIWIQGSITTAYLEMGAFAQAGTAADELIAKYADKPDFVKQVNALGGAFRKYKQYAKAEELHRYLISLNLSSPERMAALMELAADLVASQGSEKAKEELALIQNQMQTLVSISQDGTAVSQADLMWSQAKIAAEKIARKDDDSASEDMRRLAELTGFADGVLELEFAGQKKAVHFVAAPTEKPGSDD